jgi:type VI secretion system protein ImpH
MAHDGRAPSVPLVATRVLEVEPTAVAVVAPSRAAARRELGPEAPLRVRRTGIGFQQALRRIECAHRDRPRLGTAPVPAEEPVRLRQDPVPQFEAGSVVSLERDPDGGPDKLQVGFFGAFGPNGPLPLHLTEYAYSRAHNERDSTFAGFLNVFHHRFLLLFYRAWASAQPTVARDRPGNDPFSTYLRACAGQPLPPDAQANDPLEQLTLLLGRHFSNRSRHPEGLEKLLHGLLGVPARVNEFVGEWLPIPDEYCWRIGAMSPDGDRAFGLLGETTCIGTEVWDCQHKFEVVLGPLRRDQLEALLPGGPLLKRVVELVRRYAGGALRWTLRLVLSEPDRQPAVLGVCGRTGINAFIGGADHGAKDSWEDLVIDPLADNT